MILVHQMGKVGSTSIFKALREKDIHVIQTHSIGKENIINAINGHLDPLSNIERLYNEKELLFSQLVATKILVDYQHNPQEPLKVISLTRDPYTRWISALIQNYFIHLRSARELYRIMNGKEAADGQCMDFAFQKIVQFLQSYKQPEYKKPLKDWFLKKKHRYAVDKNSDNIQNYYWNTNFLNQDLADFYMKQIGAELLLPLQWFYQNMEQVFDVDIFNYPLQEDMSRFEHNNIEFLLIKFELLVSNSDKINRVLTDFIGSEMILPSANVSKDKPGYDMIKQLAAKYKNAFADIEILRKTKYCQHFNYQ